MSRAGDWEPLAPADPVPGDVYETSRLARDLQNMALTISDQAVALRRLASSQTWHAETEQRFAQTSTKVADDLAKVHRRYEAAAEGVTYYATQLDAEQSTTASLLVQARQLQSDQAAAQTRIDAQDRQPTVDASGVVIPKPASYHADQDVAAAYGARLRSLQNEADEATVRIRHAAAIAADHIGEVAGHDGLKDGFWDEVGDVIDHVENAVRGAIDDIASKVADGIRAIAPLLNELSKIAQLVSAVAGFLALVTFWIPGGPEFFGAVAMAAGAVALAADTLLFVVGKKSIGDLLLDGLAVASGAIARVAGGVLKGVAAASKLEQAGADLVTSGRLSAAAKEAVESGDLAKAAVLDNTSVGRIARLYGGKLGRLTQKGFMTGGRVALQDAVKEGGPIADRVSAAGGKMKFGWQETKAVVSDLNPSNVKALSPSAIRQAAKTGLPSMRTAGWHAVMDHGFTAGQWSRLGASGVIAIHDSVLGPTKVFDTLSHPGKFASPNNYDPTGHDMYDPKEYG